MIIFTYRMLTICHHQVEDEDDGASTTYGFVANYLLEEQHGEHRLRNIKVTIVFTNKQGVLIFNYVLDVLHIGADTFQTKNNNGNFPDCQYGFEHVIDISEWMACLAFKEVGHPHVTMMLIIKMTDSDMDRCNQVCVQRPAVHRGLDQSPSTLLCVLDRCHLLAHPFFPFINVLINLESRQNCLMNLPYYKPTFAYFRGTNSLRSASHLPR